LRHSDGSTVTIVARDTVKFSVEKIVWPSNETGHEWKSEHTSKWNGFELPEGWYIEKSLEELIKPESEESGIGYIRTAYPEKVTPDPSQPEVFRWEGTPNQNSTAKSTVAVGDSFRITVSYAFVEGPNDKGNYVDAHDPDWPVGRIAPSFFGNSGIYIDNKCEIQIYDTAALVDAIDNGRGAVIAGLTRTVTAEIAEPKALSGN
jgi:hypothetical protein